MATEVMTEFTIYGDDFDPNVMTERLGLIPTRTRVKGEPGILGLECTITHWCYATGYHESDDIDNHFLPLVRLMEDRTDELLELKSLHAVNYVFGVVIKVRNGNTPAVHLNEATVSFAAKIGAEFDFDLYMC